MVSNAGHDLQVQCRLLMKYTEDLANQIAIITVSAYLVVIQVTESNILNASVNMSYII